MKFAKILDNVFINIDEVQDIQVKSSITDNFSECSEVIITYKNGQKRNFQVMNTVEETIKIVEEHLTRIK